MLVGGEGTRLRPLTLTVPKQMLPVVEVPMIGRVLTHLSEHGVDEAVLSLGYRPDAFVALCPEGSYQGMAVTWVVEPEPLDTAGAVRWAADGAGVSDPFLVMNGDVLTDLDLVELVDLHQSRGAEGTIALTRVPDPSNFGSVRTGPDGQVLEFVEKPAPGQASGDQVNAGVYVLEPSVLDRIPGGRRVSIEREVFPAMAREGSLFAASSPAYWIDIGTPARYLTAHLDLLAGVRPGPPAPGAEPVDGDVWVLGKPVVDGRVRGPALVSDAAYVARDAEVDGSVVGAGARVHPGARVITSVLLPGAAVRAGAVVEDSIVGEQAVVGEGAVLSNLTVVGGGWKVEPGGRWDGARLPVAG